MERPTFSQSWSRVNQLTPTLRPRVQVRRRLFRGQPWYVLHDPLGNQFSRLNPVAYHLVGLFDGRRTVEQAWEQTLKRYGDDAPTQGEVIGLLSQLNQSNLLRVDLPADAEPLLERRQRQQVKQWSGQAMSILFLRMPLFNPDQVLRWLLPLFRPLLSVVGLALWVIGMAMAAAVFLPHLPAFVADSSELLLSPANWGWLMLLFIFVKAFHELGHGLVCRRFGGGVFEAGLMLLVLFPSPYMDTTTAWGFDSRWKRVLVGVAGMMFELAVAGVAALVWVYADDELVRQLAHNVVFIASVGTLFFNGNPLMRFDGYYILSDVLDVPNLYERATSQLKWYAQRYLFGLTGAQPPTTRPGERATLTIYGVLALAYRVLVMFGIVLLISGFAFTLGLMLAAWTVIAWVVIPAAKFVHWLASSTALHQRRGRALAVSAAAAAAAVAAIGLWPAPDHRRALGVVEPTVQSELILQTAGIVRDVAATAGDRVEAGQIILTADNPQLRNLHREITTELAAQRIARRDAMRERPSAVQTIDARIDVLTRERAEVEARLAKLTIRSPIAGLLVADRLAELEGRFIKAGRPVGRVVDPRRLRVTALVGQSDNALNLLNQVERVELRVPGRAQRVMPSRLLRVFDSGRYQLPHLALSTRAGGAIPLDPQSRPEHPTTERPYFHIWLAVPDQPARTTADLPLWAGQRVHVRFTLEQRRPLLAQWVHRLRQVFGDRLTL